ncbi:taste receptor type 2 member 4 [Sarcophilus harrisii]|uniref:taste receptor type 2 member 4 n=1 Tax=Sarcophilus harrisii TaxID=9305 RepID=UPI000273C10B|nr:taste receptor type 2 member 4 [Sarcophilus harrisii]
MILVPTYFFFNIFIIIFSLIQLLIGIAGNLLIMAVNCRTWIQSKNFSSFDMILCSLSITRCLCLCLMFLHLMLSLIFLESKYPEFMALIILNAWIFLDSWSLWIVTLLNAFYCVKIASFNHSLFLWLKRNLSMKTPWLLLACLLVPLFSHFLSLLISKIPNPFQENVSNSTMVSTRDSIFLMVAPVILSFSLQFIINLVSCSLLISSLRKHMQKMQKNANSFWNPQTKAHVGAMKVMIYFLILYIPYSIARLIVFLPSLGIKNFWLRGILTVVNCSYSPGHTIFIILLHPKLKARVKNILWCN